MLTSSFIVVRVHFDIEDYCLFCGLSLQIHCKEIDGVCPAKIVTSKSHRSILLSLFKLDAGETVGICIGEEKFGLGYLIRER